MLCVGTDGPPEGLVSLCRRRLFKTFVSKNLFHHANQVPQVSKMVEGSGVMGSSGASRLGASSVRRQRL
jgi:hypothetical protein